MRIHLIALALILSALSAKAQQTVEASIWHDGIQRSFIVYVPAIYDGSEAVPMLLNYHGYTGSAQQQMEFGDFRSIADTAGFIIVHPQGTPDWLNLNHWNVGGWTLFSTVDDVGFTEALIDAVSTQLNIDQSRIYSTGMSNGGFMSFLLACQLSERIAAIASVTGSMTPQTFNECDPQRPVPVLQIHGTADDVVAYTGGGISESIREAMRYWIQYNNCPINPVITEFPDVDTNDGTTAAKVRFSDGDEDVQVEHIRVFGGGHDWPGSSGNMDFDASSEVWRFLSRFDLNGLRNAASPVDKRIEGSTAVRIYPNPFKDVLNIDAANGQYYILYSMTGAVISQGLLTDSSVQLDLSDLSSGVYILDLDGHKERLVK